MTSTPNDRIAELARQGDHRAAAALALSAGDAQRAAQLFADVWDWPAAQRAAVSAGRRDLAYQYAIASNDAGVIAQALEALLGDDQQCLPAAEYARGRGRHHDAARLLESAGDLGAAAEAFVAAGELFDAARCQESRGEYREAGKLYELRLKDAPDDARAALRLARILASFGRYKPAIAALQRAEADPEQATGALRMMVACFAALQMDEAAGRCLERLGAREPGVPVTVRAFLEQHYGHGEGLAALQKESVQAELLAGRYRTLEALGSGATGRVLRARDTFYDREVAVKVLTIGGGERGRDAYARFAREARIATALDHPNIVRVMEFHAAGPFLVMELMAGGTLERRLQPPGKRLPLDVVAHVLRGLTAALRAVHQRGITHRDVKPANVFFGATGEVKLGDFGASHLADLSATLTSAMVGTLAYMAPEQVTGGGQPSAATDLYALGVVAFQMLTGTLPFAGPDFVTQHLNEAPPLVSQRAPVLGTQYDALVSALLMKDAAARVQDANALHDLLAALPWVDPETDALATASPEAQRARELAAAATAAASAAAQAASGAATVASERFVPVDSRSAGGPVSSEAPPHRGALALAAAPAPPGARLLRDTLLGREVLVLPVDAARAAHLTALAAADHPHLQAVFDVDPERGEATLERPRGVPLTQPVPPEHHARIKAELSAALHALHERGLAHGSLTPQHALHGPGRAVLLLPSAPGGDPADDLLALERLFA
ncbi:MAG: protein kinase [Sandaracinaceae bacterium]|nr:protein kinase [Sandaracinaceae bacterium]